jgi:ribonuclease HII
MFLHLHEIEENERNRLEELVQFEKQARLQGYKLIAGVDEAGRGPLAGPVVAAACILPEDIFLPGVNDSKKLLPKKRAEIFEQIKNDPRIVYGIGIIPSDKIDHINIYQATIQAMLMAIEQLSVEPDYLLVDGLKLPHPSIPSLKIIQGDAKSQSIAAASIIAKETRDSLMCEYHEKWPHYGFGQHKGYGTPQHLAALQIHGPCSIHRFSFSPVQEVVRSGAPLDNRTRDQDIQDIQDSQDGF